MLYRLADWLDRIVMDTFRPDPLSVVRSLYSPLLSSRWFVVRLVTVPAFLLAPVVIVGYTLAAIVAALSLGPVFAVAWLVHGKR